MVVSLTGITVISVALLAWINQETQEPIVKAKADKLTLAIDEVLGTHDNDPTKKPDTIKVESSTYVIYPATLKGESAGAAVESSDPKGFGGELKVLVGFDKEGVILNYTLLAHKETPGLGSKAEQWFKKGQKGDIIGKKPGEKPLQVTKDGGEVDAITGSTITSRAFLRAINRAYQVYEAQKEQKSTATDGNSGASPQAWKGAAHE